MPKGRDDVTVIKYPESGRGLPPGGVTQRIESGEKLDASVEKEGRTTTVDFREEPQEKTTKPTGERGKPKPKAKDPMDAEPRQSRSLRRSVRRREPKITHREVERPTLTDDPAVWLTSINTRALVGREGARREFVETLDTISPEERRAIREFEQDDVISASPVSLGELKDIGKGELDPRRVEGITVEERLRDPSMEKRLIDI